MLRTVNRLLVKGSFPLIAQRALATQAPNLILKDATRPMRIDRELPDPTGDKVQQRLTFVGFTIAMGASLALIFNYEKTESPIVVNTLYYLRRSPRTRELLGENIEFDGIIPWVFGELNQVSGNVNIKFHIKGSNDVSATVRLIADRENRGDEFLIHEWTLTVGDEQLNLLSENDSVII